MSHTILRRNAIILTAMMGLSPAVARGGLVGDIATGFGAVGFDFRGNRNVLSGGIDFLATNTFRGNPLDFGLGDLTLQGSLSLAASTSSRGLRGADFTLRTAPDDLFAATPLNYVFNVDLGLASARVSGSALLDTTFSINELGFYDLGFTFSSRQTVERAGALAGDPQEFDFDLGPVNLSGNVLADVLVVLTDPLYQNAGVANPFAGLSAITQLKGLIEVQSAVGQKDFMGGADPADLELVRQANAAILQGIVLETALGTGGLQFARGQETGRLSPVVPEPAVAVLLLLGLPLLFRRR